MTYASPRLGPTRGRSKLTLLAVAITAGVALAACSAERANAANLYYVAANGNDNASGTSRSTPWRTVDRVNRAALQPGDTVVFRAKDTFRGTLSPSRSGKKGKRIIFSSYGPGRAKLPNGVFLRSVSHIQIDQFTISGPHQGIAGSSGGSGSRDIVITRNVISNVSIGINSPHPRDSQWRIRKNRVVKTGDSAIIVIGSRTRVRDNFIAHAGRNRSITYGKHGVYAKGPAIQVIGNRILHFATEGISTRYRNARIAGNLIRYGEGGIAYYRNDRRHGTTSICRNSISNVDFGIYIDRNGLGGGGSERFRIIGNRVHNPGGTKINVPSQRVQSRGNTAARSLQLMSPSCR